MEKLQPILQRYKQKKKKLKKRERENTINNYMDANWIATRKWTNFLETYGSPRVNQEETDHLNRLFTGKETELAIKTTSLQTKTKVQKQMASLGNLT